MSALKIKDQIYQCLEKVTDESFLRVVHSMLHAYVHEQNDPIIGYEIDGTPIRASIARQQLEADLEAAKQGDYITLEDLEKEVEAW